MRDWVVPVSEVIVVNTAGTGALTPDHDSAWVTAEMDYVVPDPFEGHALIEQAEILVLECA